MLGCKTHLHPEPTEALPAVGDFLFFFLLFFFFFFVVFLAVSKQHIGALPPPTDVECESAIYSIQFIKGKEKSVFILLRDFISHK